MASKRLIPARVIHPGEILNEELKERGISPKDFALQAEIDITLLNDFINGQQDITEELALKFEKQLDIPLRFWMNLHNGYIHDLKQKTLHP